MSYRTMLNIGNYIADNTQSADAASIKHQMHDTKYSVFLLAMVQWWVGVW